LKELGQRVTETHALSQNDGLEKSEGVDARSGDEVLDAAAGVSPVS
jgi:hypothetical protein